MEPAIDHDPAIVCAENISFLYLLHSVPTLPARNALEMPRTNAQGYSLSLKEECRLAESLAFLANDSDDSNHIPALCIQQDPEVSLTNVLLAVNCARWQAGIQSLQRLKTGFETIFLVLAYGGQEMERDVFSAIVSMCTKRILLRLRLAHSKRGAPKRSIQQALLSATECLRELRMTTSDHRYHLFCTFIKEAKHVGRLADDWVNHQTLVPLEELVDSIYHLRQAVDIEALFGDLTSRNMDPSGRRSLVNIINKIARYREIARYLYRMSRKGLLLQMRLTTIDLPVGAYVRPPKVSATLEHVFARIQQSFHNNDITRIRRLLDAKSLSVKSQFAAQAIKTLTESKIHAEIQILYFLEMNPSSLPPRIVASSKDACFLCNAFIHMHGKMHTARTHGRLYPGWRLPFAPTFVRLEQRFNVLLESKINTSLKTLLVRNQKTAYPDPNESTLLTLPLSTSTLHSLPVPQGNAITEENTTLLFNTTKIEAEISTITIESDGDLEQVSEEQLEIGPRQSEEPLREGSRDEFRSDPPSSRPNKAVQINTGSISNKTSTASSETASDASNGVDMMQGQPIILKGNANLFGNATGRLHLHIEYQDQNSIMDCIQTVTHSLTWLNDVEAERLVANEGTEVIDVEQMDKEITRRVDGRECLFIAARGVVVRIAVMNNTS